MAKGDAKTGVSFHTLGAKLTGLPESEIVKIAKEVQDNIKRLDGCAGHDFSIVVPRPGRVIKDFDCANCGGRVDARSKRWYELGLKHALARARAK